MSSLLSKPGAIVDVGLSLSWDSATVAREANLRAAILREMGIGHGSVVAILHGGTARFFADLFATWNVGAAAACLDSSLTSSEIKNVVEFTNAAVLLVDGVAPTGDVSIPVVDLGHRQPASSSVAPVEFNPDDTALLLFTSGTTGTPKGVVLTFGAISARIEANIAAIGTPTLARSLVTLPTFFGHGLIGNSLTPLLSGGTIVLHPRGMPLINNLGRIVDEHRISFMSSVPSLWRLALTCSGRPTGKTLLRVHVGSAPLSASLWSEIAEWSGAEVVNCYGITETANWIAGASSRDDGAADGLVGRMWGGNAGVMDEGGAIRPEGTGEIVVKSSCLMSGYYKRPDLTAAAFNNGWFRTGDQGLIDENNRIWVTGRIKDEINRGGFKVQPAEIDALLEGHPAVAEACVFGIPDPMGGEAIAAAIRLETGENVSPLSLQSWCNQRLRRAAVPEHWYFVSEIPRTARGKVSREVVRSMLAGKVESLTGKGDPNATRSGSQTIGAADGIQSRTLPGPAAPPTNDIERRLLELWQSILGNEQIGIDDDYFALGGTSLMVARMFAEISQRFTVKLPISTIVDAPTVRTLSRYLEGDQRKPTPSLVDLKPGGRQHLFMVHDGIGETLLYLNLARRMPDGLTVVGVQPHSIRGVPLAHTTIEEMATFYVQQIRARQPDGPYLFAGMCAGGVVAYEMASQLIRAGAKVDLVALFDANAPQARKKAGRITEQRLGRLKRSLGDTSGSPRSSIWRAQEIAKTFGEKSTNALVWEIRSRVKNFSVRVRLSILRQILKRGASWPALLPELGFQEIINSAQDRYVPAPLANSSVVLVRATAGEGNDTPYIDIYADPTLGWGSVTANLTIVDVDGGHSSMLQEPLVQSLASSLTPYVTPTEKLMSKGQ
jgi:acyl-CoA synthetase (AMP-forming)/AMP-acid ligase II/thioesterase domain-containing protein/acyl carrier protein